LKPDLPPPLAGLRVLELGRGLAAGIVGMLLAEQGAEVVRLDLPGKGTLEPVLHAMLGRGKLEVTFLPADTPLIAGVVDHADVLIDDTGDLGLTALGLAPTELGNRNPRLIRCRLSAFGSRDPRRALPDHEAVTGMAGFLYDRAVGRPLYHSFPVGSVLAALYAAAGVVAALIARRQRGYGQEVEACRYEATLYAQVLQVLVKSGVPRSFLPLKMVATPFMSTWKCKDGRYVYLHVTLPAHNRRFVELLQSLGSADDAARLDRILSAPTRRDPSQVKSVNEVKKIRRAMSGIFRKRSADEWEQALGQELCCIKVRTVAEWIQESTAAGMSDVCTVTDPSWGELTTVGPAIELDGVLPTLSGRRLAVETPASLSDRWRAAAAHEPASDRQATGARATDTPPLAGVRVLDMSRVIAGPAAARVLAELGADVVSLQSPTKLDWALSFHLVFNAGKRSVTLDFTTDQGKVQLWRLIEHLSPDVLIQNYRSLELARQIGVGPEQVRARLPTAVYTHLNAYGETGAWRDRPGFEQVVQAVTGIQLTYGRGETPRLLPSPILDIGSGLLGAFGTLLGLYRRQAHDEGATVSTHMTTLAILFQLADIAAGQGPTLLARSAAPDAPALDPSLELEAEVMHARDGPLIISARRRDLRDWLVATGLRLELAPDGRIPWPVVASFLRRRRVREWAETLREHGFAERIGLLGAGSFRRLCADVKDLGPEPPVARRRVFPGAPQPLVFVRCPVRLSRTPVVDLAPPALRGSHTVLLMAAAGIELPPGAGVIPYPPARALVPWLFTLARWGWYLWRTGGL
jgi:crotonobetainyl-CoA:carnitine CoA-transferase CaiB-like acyl-CoA transferase